MTRWAILTAALYLALCILCWNDPTNLMPALSPRWLLLCGPPLLLVWGPRTLWLLIPWTLVFGACVAAALEAKSVRRMLFVLGAGVVWVSGSFLALAIGV